MLILAVDTSGPVAGAALMEDGLIRYEAAAVNHFTHSESLMPMIEEAFERTQLTLDHVTHLAVTVGPGSFTGVRIGVSAVKAMSHATGKPCVAVDALEAISASAGSFLGVVCPIQDARVSQVYGAAFLNGQRVLEDSVLKIDEYIACVSRLGEKLLFTGDGVQPYRAAISEMMGNRASFAPAYQRYLRPAAVAWLASRDAESAVDYLSLQPLYLRAPQAERERKEKERKK